MESAVTPTPVTTASKSLHPNVVKTALTVAVILPMVLLVTLVLLMVAMNYNVLNWME